MFHSTGPIAISLLIKLITLSPIIGIPSRLLGLSQVGSLSSSDNDCKVYQIVAARGTDEPQSGSPTYANLIKIVESGVPGGSNMEISYNADMEYFISPRQGADAGTTYLTNQAAQCPNQVYVLVGYSKGAMVITKLLAKLPIPSNKIAAVVLFGNPYHKANAPQNRCSGTGGEGFDSFFRKPFPQQFVPVTYDCCIQGDMICQTIGTMEKHTSYAGSQDERNAAAFVISQLTSKSSGGRVKPTGILSKIEPVQTAPSWTNFANIWQM